MKLGFGVEWKDLHAREGLEKLQETFLHYVETLDPSLAHRYREYESSLQDPFQQSSSSLPPSSFLLALAPILEGFLGYLFQNHSALHASQEAHQDRLILSQIKRAFVQRIALKKYSLSEVSLWKKEALEAALIQAIQEDEKNKELTEEKEQQGPSAQDPSLLTEGYFAHRVGEWLKEEQKYQEALDKAAQYAAWATLSEEGKKTYPQSILFHVPGKIDPHQRVHWVEDALGRKKTPDSLPQDRWGFNLTDPGMTRAQAFDQAHYCIHCHPQKKDSCRTGMNKPINKEGKPHFSEKSPLGCPLDQKISEMNLLKSQGLSLAALAVAMIDNPMIPATGHRICQECSRACIYQKQDPVAIPSIETQILTEVLDLPWGVEIYRLLTQWNPLKIGFAVPRSSSGYKVLVVGAGPAGFTLSHYLLREGHTVMAIDGLKIEPLQSPYIQEPILSWSDLQEPLSSRRIGGFGGVMEYGITSRWNKNFLTLIRLTLERNPAFFLTGGIRFGGTITFEQALSLGFDHIALCMGAGKPTQIPLPNGSLKGIRMASDFLMALQLTGAARENSLANLDIRLPVVVVGGGLTAMDTATEALAYYPVQVEKFFHRYQELCQNSSEEEVRAQFQAQGGEGDLEEVDEFLAHGRAIVEEKKIAQQEQRPPRLAALVQQWGGVTLLYRKDIRQAPSYQLNPEEVTFALREGIWIEDSLVPVAAHRHPATGALDGLTISKTHPLTPLPSGDSLSQITESLEGSSSVSSQSTRFLKARSLFIAAGTQPNTALLYDSPAAFDKDGDFFRRRPLPQQKKKEGEGTPMKDSTESDPWFLVASLAEGKGVTVFGDMHPEFSGSVVKAMESAKKGVVSVSALLKTAPPLSSRSSEDFLAAIKPLLSPVVEKVTRLAPQIVEVTVKAPMAAQNFQPGQFYRLQNFETYAPVVQGTPLAMEGLAVTGASVQGPLLSTIVLEMGGSSTLCSLLKPGEPVVLMGPTGAPTEIPYTPETVLLVGGGLGNAVLFSVGQALRARGHHVLYCAGYKKREDRYKEEEIEKAADQILWACDENPGFLPSRPQDEAVVGTVVEALIHYAQKDQGRKTLSQIHRMIVIGSNRMMEAVARARHTVLKPFLSPHHIAIGSINSPMQCMMKEICAQCLQRHVDPHTGQETFVYSCAGQDQPLDWVDWDMLDQRLNQNHVQEQLTAQWIRYLTGY